MFTQIQQWNVVEVNTTDDDLNLVAILRKENLRKEINGLTVENIDLSKFVKGIILEI